MLVLSRKAEEFVQIGENIIVKVIKTASGSVKIGIDAPGGVRVLRGELFDEVDACAPRTFRPLADRDLEGVSSVEACC